MNLGYFGWGVKNIISDLVSDYVYFVRIGYGNNYIGVFCICMV